jgi:uncharacterized membrane protein
MQQKTEMSPDRFKALSDGVFSIALTLLIIDVVAAAKQMQEGTSLAEHLIHHWGTGAAYLVGFLTIFVCWVNHHVVLDATERADRALIWIGGFQLALVSAVPLPTALLAEHITDGDSHTAFFMYGVTFFLMATSFWALCLTVLRGRLYRDESASVTLLRLKRAYLVAVGWNVLCMIALQVNVFIALPMWVAMFGVFAFPVEFALLLKK